jgi:hypothetical protein
MGKSDKTKFVYVGKSHRKGDGSGVGSGNWKNHPILGRLNLQPNLILLMTIQVGDRIRRIVRPGKKVPGHTGSLRFDKMKPEMKIKYCVQKSCDESDDADDADDESHNEVDDSSPEIDDKASVDTGDSSPEIDDKASVDTGDFSCVDTGAKSWEEADVDTGAKSWDSAGDESDNESCSEVDIETSENHQVRTMKIARLLQLHNEGKLNEVNVTYLGN